MARPSSRSPDAVAIAALADRLRPVTLKLSRHLRREAQTIEMSALDAQILAMIGKQPGVGISELAEGEQMSRPTMSVHVKRLEASGWVSRGAGAADSDRRRVSLRISAAGRRALDAVRRSRNDWLEARVSRLTADERTRLDAAIDPLLRMVEMVL